MMAAENMAKVERAQKKQDDLAAAVALLGNASSSLSD